MCEGCWNEMGSPKLVSPKIREAARLIDGIYEFSGVGGNAHIVVDDFNLGDDSIQYCLDHLGENFHEAGKEQLDYEKKALLALKELTLEERASALALHGGYFAPEENNPPSRGIITGV